MTFRTGRYWWCKKIVTWGAVLLTCYWGIDYYLYWSEVWDVRDYNRKELAECRKKLSDLEYLPIVGGGQLDTSRLNGFFWYLKVRNGECVGDNLEGAFWWTGKELRNSYDEVGKKDDRSAWGYFKLVARLYVRKPSNKPHQTGYQYVSWPEELTIRLKNYPGLEFWLRAPPPSTENKGSLRHFVIRDWRRDDGTPRIITCSGLGSAHRKTMESGLSANDLLGFDKAQLENIDFGNMNVSCEVWFDSFYFSGGDAKVGLGTKSLRGAPEALQSISDYLSRAVITGSEK